MERWYNANNSIAILSWKGAMFLGSISTNVLCSVIEPMKGAPRYETKSRRTPMIPSRAALSARKISLASSEIPRTQRTIPNRNPIAPIARKYPRN